MAIEGIVQSLDTAIAETHELLRQLTAARAAFAQPAAVNESGPKSGTKAHPLKGEKKSPQVIENMRRGQQARFGRPGPAPAAKPAKKKKKRNLTPEGRKAIADAVRRRWANQKAAAGNA